MASIALEKVTKVYPNGFEAVHDLDLEVADGELMVVVGPSGCGKTTVLRMIAGLEEVSSGTIRIGDRVVNEVASRDRDVAMVFQSYALYPHMSVAQNIGFALKMRKVPKAEIAERVQRAASVLGISEWLDRRPGQLSGGQRQRVAMGRAIVREPHAFLMDEPLSNLDAKLRVQMRAEVARVQRTIGVATLFVTHDQIEAMTLGHRVAVLRAGRLQQCDAPQVLYDRPANVFVAGFIGSPSMNLLTASLSEDLSRIALGSQELQTFQALFRRHSGLQRYAGQDVVVGIRPEDLRSPGPGRVGVELKGDVDFVEALGAELLVHFHVDAPLVDPDRLGGDAEPSVGASHEVGECVARIEPTHPVHQGERFTFLTDLERFEFFDPSSGLAIWD